MSQDWQSLKIMERHVDNVTILDMSGLLIEPGDGTFRTTVDRLLQEGQQKVLLNMEGIRYINSPGIGELVSATARARNAGAMLKMFSLPRKVHDILQITKLYTVWETFDDEAAAIRSFLHEQLRCQCPLCGYFAMPALYGEKEWQPQTCANCRARFVVSSSESSPEEIVLVSLQIQSYQEEYIEVIVCRPPIIRIVGRLDLFSSSALRKAWNVVAAPRVVIVDLGQITDIDEKGRAALFTLLANPGEGGRVVISVEGISSEVRTLIPSGPSVYASKAAALDALGDVPPTVPLPVRIWKSH